MIIGGKRYLQFRYPVKPDAPFDNGVCCVPVEDVGDGRPFWTWDGNTDNPSLSPSIRTRIIWGESREEVELFHGFIKGTIIEVL